MKGFSKNEIIAMLLGSMLIGILVPIVVYDKNPFDSFYLFSKSFGITVLYSTSLWFTCSYAIKKTWYLYPIPEKVFHNILIQLIAITLLVSVVVFFVGILDASWFNEEFNKLYKTNFKISIIISLFISGIYNSIYLFDLLKKSIAEKERLEKANVESQLEILKNQIKPHFLFNSLNTLATLIPEDKEQSVKYVESLAKVYRYILEIKDKKLISLHEELDCIQAYLFMLQIRFGDNLKVSINENGFTEQHHIVPLSLQLLIENAMKHNIVSNKKPLFISIEKGQNGSLLISNNLQKKEQMMPSTGTGLENIDKRYEMICDKNINVIVTESKFSVSIPLISVV